MADTISDTFTHAKRYGELGWALVGIPAGSKAPTTFGWQQRATPQEYWNDNPSHNIGLLHSISGTCALDIDDMANTRLIFEALNIDLDAILASAPRIVGRPDRGKVLFKAPAGLTTRKISWPVKGDPRRTEVVFELRAGSVQDVLPPSIHPETGNPYTWAGLAPEQIGDVPGQLLTIWREWDRFRPQLMDLCPWRSAPEFKPPSTKPRRLDGEGQSVIAAYNDATPIGSALEQAGYRQHGNRWLSPNSTSKIPGVVVFDDGRAYSHHASDPFDPAHAFDAFDVFCHYQHLGNVSAAVRGAAESLQLDQLPQAPSEEEREYTRHGASVAKALMGGEPRRSEPTGKIPAHLLTVPGVLGDVVRYSAKTCIKPQPQFDVQAALALGSVVMGRRFITDNRNMTGLYFLNVAKTGKGKEHANTVIEDVLEAAGLIDLRGPNGYTSATGVLSTLRDKPCHLTVIDEFGSYLKSAAAKGNQHRADAMVMLMEAFGRQTKTLRNLGYATLGLNDSQKKSMQVEIRSPSITLIGMTTPETFYESIGSKDVASGFLNRLLIVESKRPRVLSRIPDAVDVPDAVIAWARASATASSEDAGNLSDNGHEFPPEPVVVPFSAEAHGLFREYEQTLIDRQNAMDEQGGLSDMMNRSREIAMRLSLIVAHSLGEREISEIAAQWAIDYVDFYLRQTLEAMAVNISEGDTDEIRKKIAEAIQKAGSVGLKISELIKQVPKLGNLKKHERDGVLAMVCEDFPVERLVQTPEGGKGRPAIIHRWIGEA